MAWICLILLVEELELKISNLLLDPVVQQVHTREKKDVNAEDKFVNCI